MDATALAPFKALLLETCGLAFEHSREDVLAKGLAARQ